jgi:hypothetical protein
MAQTKSYQHSILWLCSLILEDLNSLNSPSPSVTSSVANASVPSPTVTGAAHCPPKYSQFTKIILQILKTNLLLLRDDQDLSLPISLMKKYEHEILLIVNFFHQTLFDISREKENHFGVFDVRNTHYSLLLSLLSLSHLALHLTGLQARL